MITFLILSTVKHVIQTVNVVVKEDVINVLMGILCTMGHVFNVHRLLARSMELVQGVVRARQELSYLVSIVQMFLICTLSSFLADAFFHKAVLK